MNKLESKGKKVNSYIIIYIWYEKTLKFTSLFAQSETVTQLFGKVNEKIAAMETAAAEKKTTMQEDLSLLGVPTPAPI